MLTVRGEIKNVHRIGSYVNSSTDPIVPAGTHAQKERLPVLFCKSKQMVFPTLLRSRTDQNNGTTNFISTLSFVSRSPRNCFKVSGRIVHGLLITLPFVDWLLSFLFSFFFFYLLFSISRGHTDSEIKALPFSLVLYFFTWLGLGWPPVTLDKYGEITRVAMLEAVVELNRYHYLFKLFGLTATNIAQVSENSIYILSLGYFLPGCII